MIRHLHVVMAMVFGAGVVGGGTVALVEPRHYYQEASYITTSIWGPYSMSYSAVSLLNLGVAQAGVTINVPGATTDNLFDPMLAAGSPSTIIPYKAISGNNQVTVFYNVNSTVAVSSGSIQVLLAQVR